MSMSSRVLAKQVGYALLFVGFGVWVALAAKQDPVFCSVATVLCELPPRGKGLYFFMTSAFALFAGCIDLGRIWIGLTMKSKSTADDFVGIRRPLLVALAQTVIAASILLAYLFVAGLRIGVAT